MADVSFEEMVGERVGETSIEDMVSSEEVSFEDMVGVDEPTFITPATEAPRPSTYPKTLYEMQAETYEPLLDETAEDAAVKRGLMGTLKGVAKGVGLEAVAASELALSITSGMLLFVPSKMYGALALPFGRDAADIAEEEMTRLGYQPFTQKGREAAEMVGKGFEWFLRSPKAVDEQVSRLSPELGYLAGFGAEMAMFIMTGGLVRSGIARFKPSLKQAIKLADAKRDLETNRLRAKELEAEGIPDEAMKRAQEKVIEAEKVQVELEDARAKEAVVKQDLEVKGDEVVEAKSGVVIDEAAAAVAEEIGIEYEGTAPKGYVPEGHIFNLTEKTDPIFKGRETTISVKDLKDLPRKVEEKIQEFKEPKEAEIDWFGEKEPVTPERVVEVDRQTGVEVPEVKGERSPFFQTVEEAEVLRKLYEERPKAVGEDVELFTQKLINDANRAYAGDTAVDATQVRDVLSQLATKADEFRMDFLRPEDHLAWKETVSDAAEWARGLRSEIEQRGDVTLYAGVPLDAMQKAVVDAGKKFMEVSRRERKREKIKPLDAARGLNKEFKRDFIDRSGNIRLELLDKLGDEGYDVVQKAYLTRGSYALSANMLRQMGKEVYSGLSKNEKRILDDLILADRMVAIGKYKTPKEFAFPEGKDPVSSTAYSSLFEQKGYENIPADRAEVIRGRAETYFEWMKRPLKDMLDKELITEKEYNDLVSHKYRRIKLVDIFDRRYGAKIGKRKRIIYDSGIETLAKGRKTDIYEKSSEVMALEVFNRAYGRILNNEANRALLDVARNDPKNPFVRVRAKGQGVPSGWQRFFVYEKGERKSIFLSPEMSKEWILRNPEISYKSSQYLRWFSGSPVLRTFATGINWGFALANLPRDVMHVFFAARMFDGKGWKSVYSPQLPIFLPQIGMDLARTFTDAATRGPRYQKYIEEGGGMEFLVHQGRPFARGRRLEGPADKIMDFMGYFGETSEIMTRLAVRERVIRRRAREQDLTMEEARKNKDITREATFAARDYMDFGQGGGITKAADNAMPYLNAAVQGTRGLWRTAVDNPALFSYKIAQIGAATTLLYAAMRNHAPKTAESLEGSIAMQNNLCIPLGDGFSFEDEKGQTRYIYFKIPLDPSQKFFKTFFEGAYDKYAGHEVDVERITNNLLEQSPVGTSNLPPTLSGTLGYMYNKDFWLNEDLWKKTDRPFDWPASKEEYIPGVTPEAFVDLGKPTGISPERAQYAVEELTTSGTLWSYLMGKGYDALFADVPKEKREQHIAMVLSEVPVAKRFIGVTNPYSKHATGIDEAAEKVTIDHWKQRRELDRLTEGYLFEKSVERKEVFKYIRSFKEPRVRDRLQDRFDFQYAVRSLPERSFWLRLQHLDPEVRAERYYAREQAASPEERKRLARERATIGAAGGFFSDTFWDELNKLRRGKEVIE